MSTRRVRVVSKECERGVRRRGGGGGGRGRSEARGGTWSWTRTKTRARREAGRGPGMSLGRMNGLYARPAAIGKVLHIGSDIIIDPAKPFPAPPFLFFFFVFPSREVAALAGGGG